MFTGGDGYTAFAQGTNVKQTGDLLLDVAIDYIGAHSPVRRSSRGGGSRAHEDPGHRQRRPSRRGAGAHAARATGTRSSASTSAFAVHDAVGSIADRDFVRRMHAAASTRSCTRRRCTSRTSATHSRQDFVDTNVTGTLNLLEEAVAAGVGAFVFTSTTSAFGDALTPPPGAPAAWITEDVRADPQEHLRRDQDGGRGPVRAVPPRPRAAVPGPAHVALLPRGGRRAERPGGLRRRQPQGERVPVPAGRPRGRRERAPARARARAGDRLRPLHHQRDDAVHARRPGGAARRTPRRSCGGVSRTTSGSTRSAAGRCSRASTACT